MTSSSPTVTEMDQALQNMKAFEDFRSYVLSTITPSTPPEAMRVLMNHWATHHPEESITVPVAQAWSQYTFLQKGDYWSVLMETIKNDLKPQHQEKWWSSVLDVLSVKADDSEARRWLIVHSPWKEIGQHRLTYGLIPQVTPTAVRVLSAQDEEVWEHLRQTLDVQDVFQMWSFVARQRLLHQTVKDVEGVFEEQRLVLKAWAPIIAQRQFGPQDYENLAHHIQKQSQSEDHSARREVKFMQEFCPEFFVDLEKNLLLHAVQASIPAKMPSPRKI